MPERSLARVLTFSDLVLIVIGTVIGSGIFLVPGSVIRSAEGFVGPALLVWLAGGVLSLLGALAYGELGAMAPGAGGLYTYLRMAFGPLVAFLYGWTAFLVIGSGSVATLALAGSSYLRQFVPLGPVAAKVVALVLITLVAAMNVRSTRASADVQNWSTGIKVAALLVMSVALLATGHGFSGGASLWPEHWGGALFSGMGAGMIGVLWAYEGWQYATFSAGETVNPQRTFPRAIGIGTAALIGIYLLANLGYIAALGPVGVAGSNRVAAEAVGQAAGAGLARLVAGAILVSIFSAMNGLTITTPRMYYAMARDGLFFRKLAEVHPTFGTPALAVMVGSAWAMVLALSGTFESLLTYVVFVGWIFYGLGAASVLVLRRRQPGAERPFRVPGYPWTVLVFVIAAAGLVLNTIAAQPLRSAAGLGVVLVGVPVYFVWGRRRTSAKILVAMTLALWCAPSAQSQVIRLPFTNTAQKSDRLEFSSILRDGHPLQAFDIQIRQLGAGITEISSASPGLVTWEFHLRENAPVFGFGERFNSLDHTHQVLVNASTDTPGPKGTHTYIPIPFFMDLRGYGLWLDTYAEAVFDLGATDPGEFVVRFRDNHLRILFFEGPQFPLILERYTGMVGRAKLPPYWAFAPWKSRNWHPNMAAVYQDIEKYRQLGLPASVLVLDSPWATNYNTFEMNRLQFTDPESMVRHIHDLGFKLCLWLTPFINAETLTPSEPELVGKIPLTQAANYDDARRAGYFLKDSAGNVALASWWKGRGGLIDFSNPAAVDWWQTQVRKAIRLGADAFKADAGEGSFIGDRRFADGEDPAVMRTRYSVLYNRALEQLVDGDLHGDGVLFMRSGSVGNHNLPFLWAGDNESNFSVENGLPTVVLAGLNAGLSGIPLWTSDLGGYEKSTRTPGDDILFVRWTEFSAFSPVMEVHSSINLGPWDYGEHALDIFREFSRLHMSLFPYRYAAAQESGRTGMPLMRALVLLHPLDSEAVRATDEYYFGPDLLVAPVLDGGTRRTVHLPDGDWVDYWSGTRYAGPQDLAADAPLDRIPLYVKAGTILPKIPEDVMTLVPWKGTGTPPTATLDDRRVYEIYPGPVRDLQDFEGRQLSISAAVGRTTLNLTGAPARVTIVWRFQHPTQVTLDGVPVGVRIEGASASVTFVHATDTQVVWE